MEKYYFKNNTKLSNYYICPVNLHGRVYSSSEAAYHSQKFIDSDIKNLLTKLTPDESKHVSRELNRFIRSDWEAVKYALMREVVMLKFLQNQHCAQELLSTGTKELIEDTTGWHDNIWGECTCISCQKEKHYNFLGKILMEVRETLGGNEL